MPSYRALRQVEFAVSLFLVSLGVFFLSAMAAVILVAKRLPVPQRLPDWLWVATALLLASSGTFYAAERAVRQERLRRMRTWMLATVIGGVAFFAVQSLGLWELCVRHLAQERPTQTWILLSLLVGLHALHVIVGLALLGLVAMRAWTGRFDHEYHLGLTLAGRYWHFLAIVWLAVLMVAVFVVR